jgi:hypothetical protein
LVSGLSKDGIASIFKEKTLLYRLKLKSEGTATYLNGGSYSHNNTKSLRRRIVLQLYRCDSLIACHTPLGLISVMKPQARQNVLVTTILLFLSGERITGVTCTFIYMCAVQVSAFDGVLVSPNLFVRPPFCIY